MHHRNERVKVICTTQVEKFAIINSGSHLKKSDSMAPLTRCVAGSRHRNRRTEEATDDDDEDDDEKDGLPEELIFFSFFALLFSTCQFKNRLSLQSHDMNRISHTLPQYQD